MNRSASPPLRSMLFVPAVDSVRAPKALRSGADAVILDLEDAVAPSQKARARQDARELLAMPRSCRAYVRVNALTTPHCLDDMEAVVGPGLDGVVLPMAESAADLLTAEWLLRQFERRTGVCEGDVDLLPTIETAAGVEQARQIVAAPARHRRVCFGAGDYTLDMGMKWTEAEDELLPARIAVVSASRLARLEAPLDSVFPRLDDDAGLQASVRRAAALGFQGKLCIHPRQVLRVHELLAPTPAEREHALRVVQAFEAATKRGLASIRVDGALVDAPIADMARAVLARAAEG